MLKKTTTLVISLFLLLSLILPASAQSVSFISDGAGLLYTDEIADLEEMAADLTDSYDIHAVIVTVDSLNGASAQNYADDFYDNNGYSDNGVLFLLAMTEREWYISTCGSVMYALTDYGIQQLGEGVLPYLSSGDWFNGFRYFLDSLPYYLDAHASGRPIDGYADYSGDYYHGQRDEVVHYPQKHQPSFLLSLFIGIAAAGITVLVMRFTMNTKRPQRGADSYLKDGSWNLHTHRDMYLYSNVSKTRRQQNTTSHSGGSSVHRSSGGRRHGGGGGRF